MKTIAYDANYVVLGLGDVYLGAPVATPLDPRHRLVTTKYNPARTWTPENAVGIGGAYLCVYGMEGPGGYQLMGRTLQMWNRYGKTDAFAEGKPWLLRFFDQIRFYPVSAEEMEEIRGIPLGQIHVKNRRDDLRLEDYREISGGSLKLPSRNSKPSRAKLSKRSGSSGRKMWKRRMSRQDYHRLIHADELPEGTVASKAWSRETSGNGGSKKENK